MIIRLDNDPQRPYHKSVVLDTIEPHPDSSRILIQIERDRYNGCYSGFAYTAWVGIRPSEPSDPDPDCEAFWETWRDKAVFGGGETPQEAFRDLIQKADELDIYLVDEKNPSHAPVRVVTIHDQGTVGWVVDSDAFREWLKQ